MSQASPILNSWKEIAAHLGRGVRTVQRWADAQHLPVHRITPNTARSAVFAYREELERWLRRQARATFTGGLTNDPAILEIRDENHINRQNFDFGATRLADSFARTRQNLLATMSTDLDVGLSLANIAARSTNEVRRTRNVAKAQRALDTVVNMFRRSTLTKAECDFVQKKIVELKTALKEVSARTHTGASFNPQKLSRAAHHPILVQWDNLPTATIQNGPELQGIDVGEPPDTRAVQKA